MRSNPPVVRQDGADVLLTLHVQPRASKDCLVCELPERITLRLTAPPVAGAANAACRTFLAKRIGIPKSNVLVLHGETARCKVIRIRNADAADVLAQLQSR